MRTLAAVLTLAVVAVATDPVPDEQAKEAIDRFKEDFRSKDLGAKQGAVYNLHDVPHDLVLEQLEKAMRDRDPRVRQVVALAVGGQQHNPQEAGEFLMKVYKKDFKEEEVVSSVLEALTELGYMGYWPQVKPAMKDERNAIVIRVLDLLGANQDYRALPDLLELYKIVMPKRVKWTTGEVKVDTGAAGDADQKAAEAKFNAKYGRGGSKAKAKAKGKAAGFDERNFESQLRKCVKRITGQDFDNAFDFQAWFVDHYIEIARKAAEMNGEDPDKAQRKAEAELPELKRAHEEEMRKLEEQLAEGN